MELDELSEPRTPGRSPCQGGAATQVFPAGQTALGRSPCQGGAATHVHRLSSLPARPHSAGRRVREEPRHMYTGGLLCRPDCTRQVAVSERKRNTDGNAYTDRANEISNSENDSTKSKGGQATKGWNCHSECKVITDTEVSAIVHLRQPFDKPMHVL